MLNPKIGQLLTRITPPTDYKEGFAQSGKVIAVSDEIIEVQILVDIPRNMQFSRKTGKDLAGFDTFLVYPDWLT